MGDHLDNLKTKEQRQRYALHREGIFGYTTSSLRNMGDEIGDKMPKGAGIAFGAAMTVLAVGAGIVALPELALIAGVSYMVGNRVHGTVFRRAKQFVRDTLVEGSDSDGPSAE